MTRNNDGKEPYRPYDPRKSAQRRSQWETSNNTARNEKPVQRWDGVDRG